MKAKGFKITVCVLVALIVVLGGLLALKSFGPAGDDGTGQQDNGVPMDAVADDSSLPLPPEGSDGYSALAPGDDNAA